jgi:hypothetical protein
MTESEAFAHFRLLRLAGEPKYALGPGFAEALAVDLLGRYSRSFRPLRLPAVLTLSWSGSVD